MTENPRHKENLIMQLTFGFSLEIIKYTEGLQQLKKFNLSNQLFQSATSIGANIREAQNAESKADFIHKMKIALKEVEETEYWLQLCKYSESYPNTEELINQLTAIYRVLNKIVGSARSNRSLQ
ncbi:MAG: four helix bundle protein [Bacteroidota bacterium]